MNAGSKTREFTLIPPHERSCVSKAQTFR